MLVLLLLSSGCAKFGNGAGNTSSSGFDGLVFVGSCKVSDETPSTFTCIDSYSTQSFIDLIRAGGIPDEEWACGNAGQEEGVFSKAKCSTTNTLGRCEVISSQDGKAAVALNIWFTNTLDMASAEAVCRNLYPDVINQKTTWYPL